MIEVIEDGAGRSGEDEEVGGGEGRGKGGVAVDEGSGFGKDQRGGVIIYSDYLAAMIAQCARHRAAH